MVHPLAAEGGTGLEAAQMAAADTADTTPKYP